MLNINKIKKDFPVFDYLPELVYLDSTATSLKPKIVINKLKEYYEQYPANIFRGIYPISERATEEYEKTRQVVAEFINGESDEVIFTRNTSESLNLIAYSLGRKVIDADDEIVTTVMEHHSNFVPWQILAKETGAVLKVIDLNNDGYLDLGLKKVKNTDQNSKIFDLDQIITRKTKILTLTYISNVLGTINPVKEIILAAKKINPQIVCIVDAAQALPHIKIDVKELGCDFIAFSAHKMLGPTGVGILWGKKQLLEDIYPFNYGGEMIEEVYLNRSTFKSSPHKFEAGTPAIGEVIAFKEAINYLKKLGFNDIKNHEQNLLLYCFKSLKSIFRNKILILGPADFTNRLAIISFIFKGIHPHDIGSILADNNICVRVGSHCAMPLHQRYGINASSRVSFYIYNTKTDIDRFILGLKKAVKILS